jgi:hypothetical protein
MRRKKAQSSEHREPLPPSRRGGRGGLRELSITTLWRACANARGGGKHVPTFASPAAGWSNSDSRAARGSSSRRSRGGLCSRSPIRRAAVDALRAHTPEKQY